MKSPTHLERCIVCPKCGTKTMRKSIPQKFGMEYFDDNCHTYFGVNELVNKWGYDASDLFPYYPVLPGYYKRNKSGVFGNSSAIVLLDYGELEKRVFANLSVHEDKIIATTWFDGDTVSVIDEPTFKSHSERWEAYQMVDRMFIGIPEWSMENNEVDTGALHP